MADTIELLIQQVANLTERLNQVTENARFIPELPPLTPLNTGSLLHTSYNGTSYKINLQQIIDAALSVRQNQLISVGTITVAGNNVTIPAGAQWLINNVNYSNVADIVVNIPFAEDGNTRKDILVADEFNNIYRVPGSESGGISVQPNTPLNTVLVTVVDVTDSSIGTTPPIIGDNKLDKVTGITDNAQAYVKNAAGEQVMYNIAAPSFEFIYGAAPYGGVFDAYAYDRSVLSGDNRSVPSSFAVGNAISVKQDVLNENNLGQIIDDLTYKNTPMDGDGFLMRDVLTGLAVEVPFSTVIKSSEKGSVNGVATLGADGKVPNNQIPALAISETFPVSSQAQMLALSGAEQGDVAIRSDISKSFILRVSPASVLANWSELLSPTDAVTSVNGQVGVVSLTTANVPDTAGKRYQTDNQKLFNDATSSIQNQLDSKANDANVVHKTGNLAESINGVKTYTNILTISGGTSGISFPIGSNYTASDTPLLNNRGGFLTLFGSNGGSASSSGIVFDTSIISGAITRKVQFPNKDGIFAYTSDLTGFANDADVVHKALDETITGVKTFSNRAVFQQIQTSSYLTFLNDTPLASTTTSIGRSGGAILFSGSGGDSDCRFTLRSNAIKTTVFQYTMPDNAGVLALKSDLPVNPITGTGTTNFIPKFTAIGVLGNSSAQTDINGNFTITGGAGSDVLNLVKSTGASLSLSGASGATQSVKLIADNTSNPDFLAYVGGAERLRIQATTGSVGIGIITPSSTLHVHSVNSNITSFSDGFSGNNKKLNIGTFGSGVSLNVTNWSDSTIGNLALLPSGGNVLIGTTTDNGAKLQVNGTISTTGIVATGITGGDLDAIFLTMPDNSTKNITASYGTATANVPSGTNTCSVIIIRSDSGSGSMLLTDYQTNKVYSRSKWGTWSAWVEK